MECGDWSPLFQALTSQRTPKESSNATATKIHCGPGRVSGGSDFVERPLSTGQATAAKRERQRKQPSGGAEFTATNLTSGCLDYPDAGTGGAISDAISGAHDRQRAAAKAPHYDTTL